MMMMCQNRGAVAFDICCTIEFFTEHTHPEILAGFSPVF